MPVKRLIDWNYDFYDDLIQQLKCSSGLTSVIGVALQYMLHLITGKVDYQKIWYI